MTHRCCDCGSDNCVCPAVKQTKLTMHKPKEKKEECRHKNLEVSEDRSVITCETCNFVWRQA